MKLRRVPNISGTVGLCLREVLNEIYDVADIVWAPWSVYSMGHRDVMY